MASRLRIALFGTPSAFSEQALARLSEAHDVVTLAMASRPRSLLSGLRRLAGSVSALESSARSAGVPVLHAAAGEDDKLAQQMRDVRPDLICIAFYPHLIPASVTSVAALGAINAHPSLLPRHRGPLPLFWTYHADDRVAGVTVHLASERLDAGDIVVQDRFDLPRGHPVAELNRDVGERAARLLCEAADAFARGTPQLAAQDEAAATRAPLFKAGQSMVDFDTWDVERTWHFLAGLQSQYQEPIRDSRGNPLAYREVRGYRHAQGGLPSGVAEATPEGIRLHCRGGIIELA